MNYHRLKIFFVKSLILVSPFFILIITYVIFDPAKIVRHYTNFNNTAIVNRDYISTQTYINTNPKYHYQSFIFGSSRSVAYNTSDWAYFIHDKNPYHFDALAESLFGVYSKIQYLHKNDVLLKHVLIVCDRNLLKNIDKPIGGPLFATDYRTANSSFLEFQLGFVKAYFSDFFWFKYLRYKLSKNIKYLVFKNDYSYYEVGNNAALHERDMEIAHSSARYYKQHIAEFKINKIAAEESEPVIRQKQRIMLYKIAGIFRQQHTDYRIVISPLLDKIPLNIQDVETLTSIFGVNRVYNYSGLNKFTQSRCNYYEWSHYRPQVAQQIMREIYAPSTSAK